MLLNSLQQPYPFHASSKRMLIQAFLFGLFIFLFLILFQPFGLQNYRHENKLALLSGYGFITFAVMVLNHLLFNTFFKNWYQLKTWTVAKNIIYVLWIFFLIGLVNCVYTGYFIFERISLRSILLFQALTVLIGVFPLSISTMLIYHNRLKTALRESQSLNQNINVHEHHNQTQKVLIPSLNKGEELNFSIDELFYIKSLENYVEVCLRKEKILIRNTLKVVEMALADYPHLKRCHRSYLVNLQQVKSFSGNAQGLSLQFQDAQIEEIPVSRAFVASIKSAL